MFTGLISAVYFSIIAVYVSKFSATIAATIGLSIITGWFRLIDPVESFAFWRFTRSSKVRVCKKCADVQEALLKHTGTSYNGELDNEGESTESDNDLDISFEVRSDKLFRSHNTNRIPEQEAFKRPKQSKSYSDFTSICDNAKASTSTEKEYFMTSNVADNRDVFIISSNDAADQLNPWSIEDSIYCI